MDTDAVLRTAGALLFPQVSSLKTLAELTAKAFEENKPVAELRLMAQRQEIELRMMEAQAKVAQELAIARKIETAMEVDMEEYYEYVGEGGGAIQTNLNSGDVGVNVNGGVRRVSKRVFKFKGGNSSDQGLIPESEFKLVTADKG